ncbi:MAG: DNA replication/repair protein RecF [Armatimonadetes bacterium]|nr:DNA replication/repair protein RecF [Armatimonadota bacterium]
MTNEGFQKESRWENPARYSLAEIRLTDFRNYGPSHLEFDPGLNLIAGANAQGKTNLLEAVSLVSTGRLLRGGRDAHAVRHGCETATVEGTLGGSGTTVTVELKKAGRKRVALNGASLPRASDLLGRLPSVSFSAADLAVVTGEPADRRQFLDWELAQLYPAYLQALAVYKRALEQRNVLLRQAQERAVPDELFEAWEERMGPSGATLRAFRTEWVESLGRWAKEAHAVMGGGEDLVLEYVPKEDASDADAMLDALAASRRADVQRGSTTVGPHRDDVAVTVGGTEARLFGSQGQQRTAVIAVKLAVLTCAEETFGQTPVLLLDDVFSDLDETRRARLIGLTLDRGGQVFLTCTEVAQAGVLADRATAFRVESGEVRPQ